MFNNLDIDNISEEIFIKIEDFVENSDDDEAVELISILYLMVLNLTNELSIVDYEKKLLQRELARLLKSNSKPREEYKEISTKIYGYL